MPRMKLWKRIVLLAQAALGAVGLILMMLDILGAGIMNALNRGLLNGAGHVRPGVLVLWLMAFAALAALCALAIVIVARTGRAHGARLLSLSDAGGDGVLLSQSTLDQLIEDALGLPDGVSITQITADYQDHEVAVMVEITISSGTNIPLATQAMQARVREQLSEKSGIPVSSVDIKVTGLHVDLNAMWKDVPSGEGEDEVKPWQGLNEELPAEHTPDRPTKVFEPIRVNEADETPNQ